MGQAREPQPVKAFVGVLTSRLSLLRRVDELLSERLGPIDVESETLDFDYTGYYEKEMGPGLKKRFLGFERLVPPEALVEMKLFTNELERAVSEEGRRTVNLDPGYLTAARVVLASTKDYAHRIYLGKGIYGEITLLYRDRGFQELPWTYPDYRSQPYHEYLTRLRRTYLAQIASKGS
ncbi:MAG: DUF4416 family protein [Chloroflexi bacterium]|nr:DUF4416 family protein [Chloroflexota bacterium]